ncbi:triphosphatase [Undibacterium sp. GrIS 1.2]|uniref:CYTH and CHAD domain-containing protein n=1 Tax=Undibacterium sp. GrIS 1.2 TaxID=3143933 RepID=UPI0019CA06A5|nr:CYTH and CHAD domain-containing protein [Glaciimonas sp.]
MEVELKLQITAPDTRALKRHSMLKQYATSQLHEQKISDTYFDTPDFFLQRSGACLRIRLSGRKWIQTLKSTERTNGNNGGLYCRDEWESPVEGPSPDVARLYDLVREKRKWLKMLQSPKVGNSFLPIFSTNIKRTTWILCLPQGDRVECALYLGTLTLESKQIPINEIEFKLKSGDPTHLFDIALALQRDIALKISTLSKGDRGYALIAPQPYVPVKAMRLILRRNMTVEQAFQEIARNCLEQIQSNVPGVALQYDQESLHQMRVGLRRLRSAFRLFKNVIALPVELQQEIDWLSKQLGGARDWDVLSGSTLPMIMQSVSDDTQLSELNLAVLARAKKEHKTASTAVNSARYTRFILCITRWLLRPEWAEVPHQCNPSPIEMDVMDFARKLLARGGQRLLKHGRKFDAMSTNERHHVRIAAKKMRYATEYFKSLFSEKKVQPYIEALTNLQNELGWFNDAAVADCLLRELQSIKPSLRKSIGFVREYLASNVICNNSNMCKSWKKFTTVNYPN